MLVNASDGSSPRARGTRERRIELPAHRRIIPARAGNTSKLATIARAASDHPRARGEHVSLPHAACVCSGSSPRARGTPVQGDARAARERIIPARAGNTTAYAAPPAAPPDHPRARGEHVHGYSSSGWCGGSSPRARGTPTIYRRTTHNPRIIPARAGNTRAPSPAFPAVADHPRARGEHEGQTLEEIGAAGSSPRARGTLVLVAIGRPPPRIIPARAGNTCPAGRRAGNAPDHPRARGEHHFQEVPMLWSRGSSPRARGTRVSMACANPYCRIIPARAGNTLA